MYDALGAKVDSLSEPDLLAELEKLATVETDTEVKAVNYPAMITMNNPVHQPTARSSPAHLQNQPALAKRSTTNTTMDVKEDTTHKIYSEGYDNKDYTEKVDAPKIMANTSSGTADPQRAMPYFIEDGSTPDWSENFSSLRLSKVVVPSVSNITELNMSNSQMWTEDTTKVFTDKMLADQCRLTIAMMAESWGRPNSKPMDTSKVAKTPMAKHVDDRHDNPDEDISAEVTEETVENNSKTWTALKPTCTLGTSCTSGTSCMLGTRVC
jgi:hypothetical protein